MLTRAITGGVATVTVPDIKAASGPGSLCSSITSEQVKKSTAADATYGPSVSFDCTELGEHSVTLRVTQNDGQVQTCTRTVRITGAECDRSVVAWRSIREHDGLGDLGIELDAAASGNGMAGPTVETRNGGVRKVEIDFDGSITLLDGNSVICTAWTTLNGSLGTPGFYPPSQVSLLDADTMTVTFDAGVLPVEPTCLSITIEPAAIEETLSGSATCLVRTLEGDVSGDGALNLTDVIYSMLKINAIESAQNSPAFDVDLSGGNIAGGDMQRVKTGVSSPVKSALCP
jgi:hypothetical protein